MELTPPVAYRMSLTAAEVEELLLSIYTKIPVDNIRTSLAGPSDDTIPTTKAVADAIAVITTDLEQLGALALLDEIDLGSLAVVGILPISKGGTGANTVEQAQINLGIVVASAIQQMIDASVPEIQSVDLGSAQATGVLPLSKGGTGATAASQARTNLGVWSAEQSGIVKTDTFAALVRSYAEAKYTLEPGSFESGVTLTTAMSVGLHEASGKAYSSAGPFPRIIPPGTNPISAGFTDRSNERLRYILSSTGGTSEIGSPGGPLNEILYALKRVSPTESRFAGGADPTGVNDSTDALEACIEYCSPFVWKGTVSATKAAMGAVVAAMSGFGKFRITRPLKVNPFLVIVADHVGGFFGQNGGFRIIADFDGKDSFAVDSAPYNSSGVRVLGRLGSRVDWDSGAYTGCPGVSLFGVDVIIAPGRNLRGAFNRYNTQQSHIHHCAFTGANIGVQNSVCWGGSMRDNHISARAIPMFNGNDVTVDDQQNNYLSVIGTKPTTTEFDYPSYPDASLIGKTCCVFNSFGHPIHQNNIWEGGQIGAMCTNGSSLDLSNNYVEGTAFEFVIAAHTVAIKFSPSWIIAGNAQLFHLRDATMEFDVSHVAYLQTSTTALADHDGTSHIILKGLLTKGNGDYILNLPFCPVANYEDAIQNGTRAIYLSNTGDDDNTGLHIDTPVLTVQEALSRLHASARNIINVNGSCSTKYNYRNGENASSSTINARNVEFIGASGTPTLIVGQSFNELHSLPSKIENVSLEGISVSLASPAASRPIFIPGDGRKNIRLQSVNVTGGNAVYLMGPAFGHSCMATLEAYGCSLAVALQGEYGADSGWSWIDVAAQTSVVGGDVGSSGGKKISSMLYP